jgi:uncharacterized protein YndB with AHSA1/START domain
MSHELVLKRTLAASRANLWRCWSEPELLMQWFCPLPWKVTEAKFDMRAGGSSYFLMKGPNGEEFPNRGVYLEVEHQKKIVFTDAFVDAWTPSEKAFMVGTVTFEDAPGGGTLYTAVAKHWSEEDLKAHEQMGFHDGWGKAAEQLEALAKSL